MTRLALLLTLALLATGCAGSDGLTDRVLDPTAVTAEDVQSAIFTPSCAISDCHTGNDPQMELDLGDGQALADTVGVPSLERPEYERIDPYNPDDSYLLMKVTGDDRILGDRMPAEAAALSDRNIALLTEWIRQGAN
jgi:hypothetical protein